MINGAICKLSTRLGLSAALLLGGCAQLSTISAGMPSGMNAESNRIRSELSVSLYPLSAQPAYKAIRECSYRQVFTKIGGPPEINLFQLSVRNVRDRLLFTMRSEQQKSTALMGYDGYLFDFNLIDTATGSRVTTENFAPQARSQVDEVRTMHGPSAHAVNDFTAAFPHYINGSPQVGGVIAQIFDENGRVWANYMYRGKIKFRGKNAFLIDLMRNFETRNGQLTMVGFNIVDDSTMLPLLFVLDAGFRIQLEQSSCST